jgi:hypothetical protein
MAQDSNVRRIARVVGAVTFTVALGACGVISGLGDYKSGPCTENCDGGTHLQDATHVGTADATMDAMNTMQSEGSSDDASEASDDAGDGGAGCGVGQLECGDAGCVDRNSIANCGACGNACGGDASVCAGDEAGSYACATMCPDTAPTNCNGTCVDTTSSAEYCGGCDGGCGTAVAHASPSCSNSSCGFTCDTGYTLCDTGCVDYLTDPNNCGGCGSAFACASGVCSEGACQAAIVDAGNDVVDSSTPETGTTGTPEAGPVDAASDAPVPCPDGGCPTSGPSGYSSCPAGSCNGGTGSACAGGGACVCVNDSQCKSGHCVEVAGENDRSCGSSCTGTGSRDGFNCELETPGIPLPANTTSYSCPSGSGYHGASTLTCQASHTDCFCTADTECPSGKCVKNATNNNSCADAGPCTGTGTPDYRGCQAVTGPSSGYCETFVPCGVGTCNGGIAGGSCVCNNDDQCPSGQCVCSGSSCSGTGTAGSNGCVAAPSSIACSSAGGTACTTTLTPTPVLNSGHTACLCVADGDCSSGKCVNASSQCTGTCTGSTSGTYDAEDCQTYTSTADAWSCSAGNCDTVTSATGTCTTAGVPCWCTSDSQCPSGAQCATWNGCTSGACSGSSSGNTNGFHCVW